MRVVAAVLLLAVMVAGLSCGPRCETITPAPTSACILPDEAGPIAAGTPFVIGALPKTSAGTCEVTVNGSQITLSLTGFDCSGSAAAARPVQPGPARCQVPALDAGTYSVLGTSFSLPSDGGMSLPLCP